MRLTNLGRLVSDPDVRKSLGFNFDDDRLIPVLSEELVKNNLLTVVRDLAGDTSVTALKSKELRRKYIDRLFGDSAGKKRTKSNQEAEDSETAGGREKQQGTTTEQPTERGESAHKDSGQSSQASDKRLFGGVSTTGMNSRVGNILQELQQLRVQDFPNAAAVLVRCVVDIAVTQYLRDVGRTVESRLLKNIRKAIQALGVTQNDPRYHAIRTQLEKSNSIFGSRNLNEYVHNPDYHPVPSDLVSISSNFRPLLEDIAASTTSAD